MGLHIRLHDITAPNDFEISYKTGESLGNPTIGFVYYDAYSGGTTEITISGVSITYDTQYWIKIYDTVTSGYTIENIFIHEECYYSYCSSLTPTPTVTLTPTPTPTTTSTPTPTFATQTPTPTPTVTPTQVGFGCGDFMSGTYSQTNYTSFTYNFNFAEASNGYPITLSYDASNRPNRFHVLENGTTIVSSPWVGSDFSYSGYWIGNPTGLSNGNISFVYDNTKTYQLRVEIGNANPNNVLSDYWELNISCSTPTPTPTPRPLTTIYMANAQLEEDLLSTYCSQPYIIGYQIKINTAFGAIEPYVTRVFEDNEVPFAGVGICCWYAVSSTSGYVTYDVDNNTPNNGYRLIQIDETGLVINVALPNCSGSNNGGPIPL